MPSRSIRQSMISTLSTESAPRSLMCLSPRMPFTEAAGKMVAIVSYTTRLTSFLSISVGTLPATASGHLDCANCDHALGVPIFNYHIEDLMAVIAHGFLQRH